MKTKYGLKTRPVVSRSEAGNFKSYGDLDMKVLRRDANAVHEFFYGPPKSDREKCVFSVIDDGRLVSPGTEKFKTVIRRWLQPVTDRDGNTAIYLFYEDTGMGGGYDKPTQGPLCKIEEIRIRDGYLNILGTSGRKLVTYRYKIRENSDSFGYPQPVPEGQPRIDEYGTPKERPKAKPAPAPAPKSTKKRVHQDTAVSRVATNSIIRYFKGLDPSINFELPRYFATFDENVAGYQYEEMPSYFLHRDHGKILREDGLVVKKIYIDEDYLAIRCEGPLMPSDYFLIRDDLDHYAETPTPKAKPVEKPAVRPKPTPVPKPLVKPNPATNSRYDNSKFPDLPTFIGSTVTTKAAEGAVRYFNNPGPSYVFDCTGIFLGERRTTGPHVLWRSKEGKIVLSDGTEANSNRMRKIHEVQDVRIDGYYLVMSGLYDGLPIWIRSLILDDPGVPKPIEKPKEKPVVKPVPKPTKKKAPKKPAVSVKKGITYEVRVSGSIRGSYSSKAKAEAHKRDLKSKGEAAKVYVVGY